MFEESVSFVYGIKTSGKDRFQTYTKIKLQSNFLEDDGIKVRCLLVIALNKQFLKN